MTIEIKPISINDFDGYYSALTSVILEKDFLAIVQIPHYEFSKSFFVSLIENDIPAFVAVDNTKIIGWIDGSIAFQDTKQHDISIGLGIIKEYRNQGIGIKLINALIEKAKTKNITRISLSVRSNNKYAIRLYEKLGFQKEGLHKNTILIDNIFYDTISMALLIKAQ